MFKYKRALILLLTVSFTLVAIFSMAMLLYPNLLLSGLYRPGTSEPSSRTVVAGARPEVIETSPARDEKMARLYQSIDVTLNQPVSSASILVFNRENRIMVPGKIVISKTRASFIPASVFLPSKTYTVIIRAASKEHIKMEDRFSFNTVPMGEKLWVEVKLGERHSVIVYKGSDAIKYLPASGGLPESPTPTGYFYTQDRGYSFWSSKFDEGATYWVRLAGQILVHSVPRDDRWQTKDDEHAKLGLPASHGCIRLDEDDARWFFENIPQGSLVIIHN